MSTTEEFMGQVQLVQTCNRCHGVDCSDVSEDVMEQAKLVDKARAELPASCTERDHLKGGCFD